jgi:hypothetical protein
MQERGELVKVRREDEQGRGGGLVRDTSWRLGSYYFTWEQSLCAVTVTTRTPIRGKEEKREKI